MKINVLVGAVVLLLTACSKDEGNNLSFQNLGGVYSESISSSGETYQELPENPFILTANEDVSTFSVDADGGSYSNCRDLIESGQVPPKDAVRIEEFINFFNYGYAGNESGVTLNGEVAQCPWNQQHHLLRIGIKGEVLNPLPAINFVMLVDVSGSMSDENKLPLFKQSLNILVDRMRPNDRIALVTYAGSSKVVLESTSGQHKEKIRSAIKDLKSGGGTNGEGGIKKAYEIAETNLISGANNRV